MRNLLFLISVMSTATGCVTAADEFTVTEQTVATRSRITWVGQPTELMGDGDLRVGAPLPAAALVDLKMAAAALTPDGRIKVIDTLPSLDTPVCDRQTHILGETRVLDAAVERVTISADLPYAQRRFADEANLGGITYLSDYRGGNFARAAGLAVVRNGLLARAVIVVDGQGIVRHVQIVPEITQLPDMEKAFAVANRLAAAAH